MTKINITDGVYRNKPLTGVFTLVTGYTLWGGTLAGANKRRVGTAGNGYVKVRNAEGGRAFKVTVNAPVVVVEDKVEALRAEIATLAGKDRANARKRLARLLAKQV